MRRHLQRHLRAAVSRHSQRHSFFSNPSACLLFARPWQRHHQPRPRASGTCRYYSSSSTDVAKENNASEKPKDATAEETAAGGSTSWFQILLVTLGVGGTLTGFYWWARQQAGPLSLAQYLSTGRELNTTTFVPFTVVSRDQVTDDSFIITLRPRRRPTRAAQSPWRGPTLSWLASLSPWRGDGLVDLGLHEHSHLDVYDAAWRHGLWAVEVKQPQLQIVRSYTPLPPLWAATDEARDAERRTGDIRLYVRAVGEVSSYLARRRPGSVVELRGPYLGFDVVERLGDARELRFLAGGTGIAPALQVAHRLFANGAANPAGRPEMKIVWANRLSGYTASSSSIVRQLAEMTQQYGPQRLSLQCVVDEENKFIDEALVAKLLVPARSKSAEQPQLTAAMADDDDKACSYHSPQLLQYTATDPPAGQGPGCQCVGLAKGRNLIMVSGPDGFIQTLAGPKNWHGGLELQGPVGGLLGKLKQRYPDQLKNWLVLKL